MPARLLTAFARAFYLTPPPRQSAGQVPDAACLLPLNLIYKLIAWQAAAQSSFSAI